MPLASVIVLLTVLVGCGRPGVVPSGDGEDGVTGGCVSHPYDPAQDERPPAEPSGACDEPAAGGTTGPNEGIVGCGPGPTPSGAHSWEECPNGEPTGPGYELVKVRDGLVDPRPVDWLRARPREGGTVLRLIFWSGVEDCYGVARIEVDESPEQVEVTLFEGRVPEAEVCIEIAVKKAVDVPLDEPLGERRVVDGAE